MAENSNLKIFQLNRIKFNQLWEDTQAYIKATYKSVSQVFTPASPFGQILQVVLHLGRMILYYIEDSITGLNIRTAYRPDQIRGLAQLTGHTACRPIASRGAIQIVYHSESGSEDMNGQICYIPNKIKVKSKINGSTYTVLFGADNAKITMNPGNYVNATVIAGEIKIQKATGTGEPLQSFNFVERNYMLPDEYFINVYVNGELWDTVISLNDLGFNQKGCILRTGINGGIDIFFGNGVMGMIPPKGSTILVEYVISEGLTTNIDKDYANSDNYWDFTDSGYLEDGTPFTLNGYFQIKLLTDIIFGTAAEDITLTQLIAPHTSRSMVLASEVNYRYFFKRMNMFSDIEIKQGVSNRTGLTILNLAYQQAQTNYDSAEEQYQEALAAYGENSPNLQLPKELRDYALQTLNYAQQRLQESIYVDNTVYIYLIPDITKRIPKNQNYFTCDRSLFLLTDNEITNLEQLINQSGQRIITVENKIVQPTEVNFAINVYATCYDTYTEQDIYASALEVLSDYLINWKRRELIPVSDIIALFENKVKGIDSVKVQFIPDVNNAQYYASESTMFEDPSPLSEDTFCGIDQEYGDIILTRSIIDSAGQPKEVQDLIPRFRGGFTGTDGREYSTKQVFDQNIVSPFNMTFVKHIKNKTLSLDHAVI